MKTEGKDETADIEMTEVEEINVEEKVKVNNVEEEENHVEENKKEVEEVEEEKEVGEKEEDGEEKEERHVDLGMEWKLRVWPNVVEALSTPFLLPLSDLECF